MVKTCLSIFVLVIVSPIIAATSLLVISPESWGGSLSIVNVAGIAFFGLLSVPLWFTYVPVLIFVPVAMQKLSAKPRFHLTPMYLQLAKAAICGAVAGIFVFMPVIIMSWLNSKGALHMWLLSAVITGACSAVLINTVYRVLVHKEAVPTGNL